MLFRSIAGQLGREGRRLDGLRETFEQNPQQLVRQLWLETVRAVLANREAEVFSLPPGMDMGQLGIQSSPEVMQTRRNAEVDRRKRMRELQDAMMPGWNLGVRQIMINQAGRRLDEKATRGFGRENK